MVTGNAAADGASDAAAGASAAASLRTQGQMAWLRGIACDTALRDSQSLIWNVQITRDVCRILELVFPFPESR